MGPEKKGVISLPIKQSNKCIDPTFLKREAQRLISHLKCPNTLLSNFRENLTNNLDKTDDSIVFGMLYNPHMTWALSQSSALNCANRAEGMWDQLMKLWGSECLWFVTMPITWNSSGRHKHKPETFAHSRSDLSKRWGELITSYVENNQDFYTAMCEK